MPRAKFMIYRPKGVAKAFIDKAIEGIEEKELEGVFVSVKRAKAKLSKLSPTPRQQRLLRYVWMRELTFEESIGTNWNQLGPLMTRGYLRFEEKKDSEGKVRTILVVHDAYLRYVSEAFVPTHEREH